MRPILAFAVAISLASSVVAEEMPVEIPLKSIWASPMPGTQMAAELDPAVLEELKKQSADEKRQGVSEILVHTLKDKSLAYRLIKKLESLPEDEPPPKGFAVEGTGLDALKNALAHIEKPFGTLPGGEVTLVFFAYHAGQPVHLQKVTRAGDKVDIYYRLGPSAAPVRTEHYALIPLGKLSAGKYDVDIHLASDQQKSRTGRKVCKPFSFSVEEAESEELTDSGDEIALNKIWALQMPGARDVRELGSDDAARIRVRLTERTGERARAGPCFLVKGEGKEALASAAKVLVDGEAPMDKVPAGEVVTLVFYAYSAPGYVAVKSVRHSSDHVTIKYEVVTHQTSNATVHFALIPLGKLSPGNLTVNLVEIEKGGPEQYPEVKERAICDSCSFEVQ